MIKSVELHNFESHRHSLLELVPGVNIIVGLSDHGKSSILRGVRWVNDNRPSGNDFVSWPEVNDGGETKVIITTDTDTVIRSKGKEELYKVNKLELRAFGLSVPTEVHQVLNMNEMNIKKQFEPHFLLSETSGAVASHFNKVARLDVIDTATSNINSWIAAIKQTIAGKNKQLEESNAKLKTFDYLSDFERDVTALEEDDKTKTRLQKECDDLTTLLNNIDTINAKIDEKALILKSEPLIDSILADYAERKVVDTKIDKLSLLLNDIDDVQNKLDSYKQLVASEKYIDELLKLYKEKKTIEADKNRLNQLIFNIKSTDIRLITSQKNYDTLHTQYEKEFPDFCPLCNKPK